VPLSDYVKPEHLEDWQRDFQGIVYESTCPGCSAVLPLIFEEGTDEFETLISQELELRVEVTCYQCGEVSTVKTEEATIGHSTYAKGECETNT